MLCTMHFALCYTVGKVCYICSEESVQCSPNSVLFSAMVCKMRAKKCKLCAMQFMYCAQCTDQERVCYAVGKVWNSVLCSSSIVCYAVQQCAKPCKICAMQCTDQDDLQLVRRKRIIFPSLGHFSNLARPVQDQLSNISNISMISCKIVKYFSQICKYWQRGFSKYFLQFF